MHICLPGTGVTLSPTSRAPGTFSGGRGLRLKDSVEHRISILQCSLGHPKDRA